MLELIEPAVDKIMADLDGRKGMLDGVDDEIREEIREAFIDILFRELS